MLSQYRDREIYYHEREQSRLTADAKLLGIDTVVTIIIEAMDQCKLAIPRHLPGAKMLRDCLRPKLHVVGIIVHGIFRIGWLADPTIAKDSNCYLELILRTMCMLVRRCTDLNIRMPSRCIIIADNASDNKKQYAFSLNALMVACDLFVTVTSGILRTGHNHDDQDAMFGKWSQCLARQNILQDPQDFVNALRRNFPGTHFEFLNHVRNWCDFVSTTLVQLTGMGGSTTLNSAHAFSFCKRSVAPSVYGTPESQFLEPPHGDDVVLFVRCFFTHD